MKPFSVAEVRAGLAGLLVKAQSETVIIARYGKPVGLLLGFPPSMRLDDIMTIGAQVQAALQRGQRGSRSPASASLTSARPQGARAPTSRKHRG